MIYGLIVLIIGVIFICIGFLIENDCLDLFYILSIFGAAFLSVGFVLSLVLLVTTCEEKINYFPVEWISDENVFKEVEVSNTVLSIYKHRNWFTYNIDGERYTIIEKGQPIISKVKYEEIINYYNPTMVKQVKK